MKRRTFVKTAAATGAGLIILPSGTLSGKSAQDKLNIALIGAHGRGAQHYRNLEGENVVAICDVVADNMALAAKQYPNAKQYIDWRKCLEQKDLDAVFICCPDHHHAFITIWALNRGLHVYCEKPVGECVAEAREVRKVWLPLKGKLATQHGTQRHAHENFDLIQQLVRNGAVGELQAVSAWGNRTHDKTGYLPAAGPAPEGIDWEQWVGPAQMHPFNPGYFGARPGAGCLLWNMYHDFGSWQVGDMGSHTMDLAWNALDVTSAPTTAVAEGDPWNPEACPSDHHATWTIPANDWRGEITLDWYQGTLKPELPLRSLDISRIGHGAMYTGTKGSIVADFRTRMLIPGEGGDMTYFKSPTPAQVPPPVGSFVGEWINACKDPSLKTSCDFDYAGLMIETLMLGLVAHEAGKELTYDPVAGRVTNDSAANDALSKEYRKGWVLNG